MKFKGIIKELETQSLANVLSLFLLLIELLIYFSLLDVGFNAMNVCSTLSFIVGLVWIVFITYLLGFIIAHKVNYKIIKYLFKK